MLWDLNLTQNADWRKTVHAHKMNLRGLAEDGTRPRAETEAASIE
jgi:hypothetical protein